MGLPNGSGLFSELYETMLSEVDRNPRKNTEYGEAAKLTREEKQISFLNRYFVFRKTHSVDASKVSKLLKQQMQEEDDEAADEIIERIEKQDDKIDKAEEKSKVHIIRKRKAKKGSEKITIE
jgi:hydroxymethylpyrimidine pyrophosphatase-like HAD family hydrolase